MGLVDYLMNLLSDFVGKKAPVAKQPPQINNISTNSFGERYDRLTEKGDLPFGWVTRNKEFCDMIHSEFSYFLNNYLEAQRKTPMEQYSALKSFVLYLEDIEKLCKSKGECFELWFHEILTGKGYVEKRKEELKYLTANFNKLQTESKIRNDLLPDLDARIIKIITDNPGILQSELVKMFDALVKDDVREKLYLMDKSGKLERIKSGRSYELYYKQ